ncbi:site-specific integrase [Kibdelosporangium aridum]|uniref:site-specific integrase n=1 Tax=Kibdelosporangium aridum TaxID=2030 RepID=UPI001C8B39A2|nr:site-specific integrase [Kibdelosporangium aridum]
MTTTPTTEQTRASSESVLTSESVTVPGKNVNMPAGPGFQQGRGSRRLAYLTDIERSPNTVKAYTHDLKDYWVFLRRRGLDWRETRLEDIGEYVASLRMPPVGRDGEVAVLPSVQPHVTASTVNRKLSASAAFYSHQARHGVDVGELLPPGNCRAAEAGGSRSCTTSARASPSPGGPSRCGRTRNSRGAARSASSISSINP